MGQLRQLIDNMDPQEAAAEISQAMKNLFPLLTEEVRLEFIMNLTGNSDKDKIGGLVHL
jgi:hypothetical protein